VQEESVVIGVGIGGSLHVREAGLTEGMHAPLIASRR
jgi:hypothetical protein